ncbi:hypothetical protein Pmar_PMAR029234 [Perkinsus marinus ATCC 50983]|uniref:DDHD domain-containing protein n=1 Tax=Perkinsus marinus (strain ATCC 50983 / TXsc) TaxID=423536 RepID=C5KML2_PERM5|nr:hypothetical protein Pmar_PMAR029234 [Perkinsus marinus ATCC 50983]EER14170.1 hypothetical protein Pmar_PMAR029234 [Perkinsus marinus ATCC 50983]|eukprot:XP_002782375.1 hypothetical protein Pmar_PMAR029234 [Perkinsus marinus ATCC 50983]
MQEKYHLFCTNNPGFHEDVLSGRSAVCILGHSLGSVVAFDLLSRQLLVEPPEDASIDTSIATAKEPSTPAPGSSSPAVRRLHSDVGSAFSSVGSTISSWFGQPTQEQVAEQHRKSKIESALKDSIPSVKLNQGRRIDWVIQESVTEAASELWSAFGSHFSYWRHEDVVSFVVAQLVWCDKDDKQWRDKKDNFF